MGQIPSFLLLLGFGFSTLGGQMLTPTEEYGLSLEDSSQEIDETFFAHPPLPICGDFINSVTYGPVTNATTLDNTCTDTQTAQVYRAYSHSKKKRIYQHGSTWVCYDQDPGICHTYYRQDCPDDSCAITLPPPE